MDFPYSGSFQKTCVLTTRWISI